MRFKEESDALRTLIDTELERYFNESLEQEGLFKAMRYSLLAGGKRVRPILVLKFCEASGGDVKKALPYACAIEMIHTYSLIHDDLPCMDNDDLRRGKPTSHKVFGESTAAIAGDALQAAAFRIILSADDKPEILVSIGAILAEAAGEFGMCGGQYLDTNESELRTEKELETINDLKTGALLRAACKMGVVAAEGTLNQLEAADKYGIFLARAFQIRDDVLDIISSEETFGKSIGSDAANEKLTFASLLGLRKCKELINEYTCLAESAVKDSFDDAEFLVEFAKSLQSREF